MYTKTILRQSANVRTTVECMIVLMTALLALDGHTDKPTFVFRDPEFRVLPDESYGFKFTRIAISAENATRLEFRDIDATDVFFAAKFFAHSRFNLDKP